MKNKIYILLLVSCSVLYSHGKNKLNSKGKKEGFWEEYYPNTEILKWQGNFENGKEKGDFQHYDNKGILTAEKKFINDNECIVTFYKNKNIESTGSYKNRKKNGEWKYYKNGKVIIIENYKDDLLNGEKKSLYENEKVLELENYKDGKLNGPFKKYNDNGDLLEQGNYKNELKDGEYISYYSKGKIALKGIYKDDKKIGKWITFDIRGKKTEENFNEKKERKGKWIDESSEEGKVFYKKFREED